jgi:hypothetical protein
MVRQLIASTAGLFATIGAANAQYPYPYPPQAYGQQPGNSPVLSPYLNLRNGNNNAGVNYYNFVRPQLQLQQQMQNGYGGGSILAIDPYPLASNINLDPTGPIPRSTGLPAGFMNYGAYFNTMGTIGAAGRAGQPAAGANQSVVPSVPRR